MAERNQKIYSSSLTGIVIAGLLVVCNPATAWTGNVDDTAPLARPTMTSQAAAEKLDAAEHSNDPAAEYELGQMYSKGEGVPQNYTQAASWYRKAALQGHAGAQYFLGEMYRKGEGVPQNDTQAAAWYRKAALEADASAQNALGAWAAEVFRGDGFERS